MSDIVSGAKFKVGFKAMSGQGNFDISCFVLGTNEKILSESYIIFYNQKQSPCGGVILQGPEGGDSETVSIDVGALSPEARKILFAVTLEGQGISTISKGHMRFIEDGQEKARYEFIGSDFIGETALIVCELYLKDVWRLNVVGQGFVGKGLEYLITMYGGEVELPPVPKGLSPTQLITQALRKTGLVQTIIDGTPAGSHLVLGPPVTSGEVKGPVVLQKQLIIEGRGATLWAAKGPVLLLAEDNLVVKNLLVEVTEDNSEIDEACAILVVPGKKVSFENVEVRGTVRGLPGEEGTWNYPKSFQLGLLGCQYDYSFTADIVVPVSCMVSTNVSGLSVEPLQLTAGQSQLLLHVKSGFFFNDTVLYGRIILETPYFRRSIIVCGHAVDAGLHRLVAQKKAKQL